MVLGIVGLAVAGCGSSTATPPAAEAAADTAPIKTLDSAAADKPAPDAAAPDVPSPDVAPGNDAADAAAAAGADIAPADAPGADALVADSGPDLPPIHGPLVGYWPLDDGSGTTAADLSGNGGAGTLVNGPTWSTSGFPAAKFANAGAVALDGVDDFVELGVRAVPRNEAAKTVSLWFFQDAPSAGARKNLIAITDFEGTGQGLQIGLDAGRVSVWFLGDATGMITAPAAATGGWHHVAYSYDGTVNRLYADNQSLGEVMRAPQPAAVARARLGGFDLGGMEMFAGRIDDVRIYDHALDAAAIGVLAGGGTP